MFDFLPVLLGSDANVYGMARSFYQQYGVRSVAICKGALVATSNTNLVKIAVLEPDLENDETFVKTLTDYAKAHADKPLVLVSCADGYTVLMGRHRDALKPYYHFACPELQTVLDLDIKENFYRACEAHGLSYPKTATCNAQNYKNIELPFAFPVIIKASNSPAYWNCTFPHKKKVFLANNREEFDAITAAIYGSSYQDELILQEYIPGDDNCMRVLNAYCGLDHKVKLMALGRPLLEEQTPEGIGNYAAILSDPEYNDAALLEKLKNFLEDMQWEGFANMDIKYDARTGEYKMFEMNPRQGRSSYFVTAAGYNLSKWLVEDVLEHEMHSEYYVVEPEQAAIMNETKKNGGRIIAVGTTSTRTLESVTDENGVIQPKSGWTKIFIYPGYTFKAVDCLVTNFHLPESTLIMLVSALMGKELVMESYAEAVKERYRFFSFGDACLFLAKEK